MEQRNATAAVIGAGDYIGAAIAKRFAAEGFTVFAGRRNGDKLAPLVAEVEASGGESLRGRSTRARKTKSPLFCGTPTSTRRSKSASSISAQTSISAARDHRARVPQGLGDGLLLRIYRRPRGGAPDASARARMHFLHRRHRQSARRRRLRGIRGAKFGLRAVAQSAARELGPKNIHVAHLIIDAGVDTAWVRDRIKEREGEAAMKNLDPGRLMRPAAVAEAYWQLYQQPRDAWTFEQEIRPFGEKW